MPDSSFYTYSYAPSPTTSSAYTWSTSPIPPNDSMYTAAYITSVPANEPFLVSLSPDPITFGQILTITGIALNKALSVIVDGVGREFTYVNPTTIKVTLPLMTAGPKSVYVEYV